MINARFDNKVLWRGNYVCLNVLPTKLLDWKSPYERFYGNLPDHDNFKVVGSQCFHKVLPAQDKVAPREHKGIFEGCSTG